MLTSDASRPVRSLRRRAALAVVCAASVAVVGCGSDDGGTTTEAAKKRLIDGQKVALAIRDSVREQRNLDVRVVCPGGVLQAKGTSFECVATGKKTKRAVFVVTQKDDRGNVTYVAK